MSSMQIEAGWLGFRPNWFAQGSKQSVNGLLAAQKVKYAANFALNSSWRILERPENLGGR